MRWKTAFPAGKPVAEVSEPVSKLRPMKSRGMAMAGDSGCAVMVTVVCAPQTQAAANAQIGTMLLITKSFAQWQRLCATSITL